MRFYEGLTQREIAGRIGVTQMQVSRLLTRILASCAEVGEVARTDPGPRRALELAQRLADDQS